MIDCRGLMTVSQGSGRRADARLWRLDIARERRDGVVILEVAGRLGAESSGRFIEAVLAEIQGEQPSLLIDLAQVDYVSSAGLTALEAIAGRVHSVQGTLVLCALTDAVCLVVELAGLQGSLTVVATREEGEEGLRAKG